MFWFSWDALLLLQESQAAKILAKYHADGSDEYHPLIVFEMAQIRHALNVEREISENSTFFQLWSTPGNLKRLRIIIAIAIFSQWRSVFRHRIVSPLTHHCHSGNGLVSFYINLVLEGVGITSTSTKAAINGGLQVSWQIQCRQPLSSRHAAALESCQCHDRRIPCGLGRTQASFHNIDCRNVHR